MAKTYTDSGYNMEDAMKKVTMILIVVVLLSGCVNDRGNTEHDLNAMIDEKNQEIAELNKTVSELEGRIEYLRSQLSKTDKSISDSKVQVGDKYYQYYTAGGRYLEDGIVLILEAYDENQELLWIKPWEGIQISEVSPYSKFVIRDEILYIVVSGTLYTINTETGEVYWSVDEIGHSDAAPLVDDYGNIFTIGQYPPYISAIDENGNILWQERDSELHGAYSINCLV